MVLGITKWGLQGCLPSLDSCSSWACYNCGERVMCGFNRRCTLMGWEILPEDSKSRTKTRTIEIRASNANDGQFRKRTHGDPKY